MSSPPAPKLRDDLPLVTLLQATADGITVLDQHLDWRVCEVWSMRESKLHAYRGVAGTLTYTLNDPKLWPWFWIGQWIHVGQHSIYGFGRYHLHAASFAG